ncbi:MAG: hypothetical protein ACLP9L_14500 [Thermoguttaceae bacterium]
MSRLDEIKAGIQEFEKLQDRYARFGAADTEPSGVFQSLFVRAVRGERPVVPMTGEGWELYTLSMDCSEPAQALAAQAQKVVDLIESCPSGEFHEIQHFLRNHC